jgi:hypothetical protein
MWANKGSTNGSSYNWHKNNPVFWQQFYEQIPNMQQLYFAASDPRADGFTTWEYKKDLHEIKFALEEMIRKCPSYTDIESQWLREQEAEKIVRILTQ